MKRSLIDSPSRMRKYFFLVLISMIGLLVSIACQHAKSQLSTVSDVNKADFRCQSYLAGHLCWPEPGRSSEILFVIEQNSSQPSGALGGVFQATNSKFTQPNMIDDANPAYQQLLKKWPNANVYIVNDAFPKFVAENFNRMAKFSGPNCYNTALILAGFLPQSARFSVSVDEFLGYLKEFFVQVEGRPQFGDVVLYHASTRKDHVATYLHDDIVFHKLGFDRQYRYRLAKIDLVFEDSLNIESEKLTDAQSFEFGSAQILRDAKIFRRHSKENSESLTSDDQSLVDLVKFLSEQVWMSAALHNLHEILGLGSENLFDDLLLANKPALNSPYREVRLAYLRIISLKHQVFLSLEDEIYASPMLNLIKARREHCIHKNVFTKTLIQHLFRVEKNRDPSTDEITNIEGSLFQQNPEICNVRYLDLVNGVDNVDSR